MRGPPRPVGPEVADASPLVQLVERQTDRLNASGVDVSPLLTPLVPLGALASIDPHLRSHLRTCHYPNDKTLIWQVRSLPSTSAPAASSTALSSAATTRVPPAPAATPRQRTP